MTQVPVLVADNSGELGRNVGEITAVVVGAVFGIVLVIGLAMYLCLRKRSSLRGAARFRAGQEYGQPLMTTYDIRAAPNR
jgi:hypothetical protein